MIKLKNAGTKLATAMIAAGLAAGAAFAADIVGYPVNVTLPEAVSVGGTTLPSGDYTVDQITRGGAESVFVFRDASGNAAAVVAADRTAETSDVNSWGASRKTEVILSPNEDGTMHLNEMFIEGDSTGYRFMNTK